MSFNKLIVIIVIASLLTMVIVIMPKLSDDWRKQARQELATLDSLEKNSVLGATVTVGDHSYIKLNMLGSYDGCKYTILEQLDKFQQDHPDLNVINWRLEQKAVDANTFFFYGIWVDHRLKQ